MVIRTLVVFCFLIPACTRSGSDSDLKRPTLQFSTSEYSASEDSGSVTITVRRLGRKARAVSVEYASADGSATAPSDYGAVSGTLQWAAGDGSDKTFQVTIVDDPPTEVDETVSLILSNPTDGARLGVPASATLRILEDNCRSGGLDQAFGIGGLIASDPTAENDGAAGLAIDGTHLFVVGYERLSATDTAWRIEKRRLDDGSLEPAFGTGGVLTGNPTSGPDGLSTVALDPSHLYAGGGDNSSHTTDGLWRIEKRRLDDGAPDPAFGVGGAVTCNPSPNPDRLKIILLDGTHLYAIGNDQVPGLNEDRYRVEKRSLLDGTLDPAFGIAGVVTSDPGPVDDSVCDAALDGSFLYVVGDERATGASMDTVWRCEKRSLADGALDPGFGTAGVVNWNGGPEWDYARAIEIDALHMYIAGDFHITTNATAWAIQKRHLSDGALDPTFGAGGVVVSDPSPADDRVEGMVLDSSCLYVLGLDETPGPPLSLWRVEKRSLSDGSLDPSFGVGGVLSIDIGGGSRPLDSAVDSLSLYLVGFDSGPTSGQWHIEKRCK